MLDALTAPGQTRVFYADAVASACTSSGDGSGGRRQLRGRAEPDGVAALSVESVCIGGVCFGGEEPELTRRMLQSDTCVTARVTSVSRLNCSVAPAIDGCVLNSTVQLIDRYMSAFYEFHGANRSHSVYLPMDAELRDLYLQSNLTSITTCGCVPKLTISMYSFPPSAPPPAPQAPPAPRPPPSLPPAQCACDTSSTAQALSAGDLKDFLDALGEVLPVSGCEQPVCSLSMVSAAVRTGRLLSSHVTGMSSAIDVCLSMVSRVCYCVACRSNPRTAILNLRALEDNRVEIVFSEEIIPIHLIVHESDTLHAETAPLGVMFPADSVMAVDHERRHIDVHVDEWEGGWSPSHASRSTLIVSGSIAILDLNTTVPAYGREVLQLGVSGLSYMGSLGGLLPAINLSTVLFDRQPPTFSANLASQSEVLKAEAFENGFTQMTVFVYFSEPCFGTGPNGSFADSDWVFAADGVPGLNSVTATVMEWPLLNERRQLQNPRGPVQAGIGTTRSALGLNISASGLDPSAEITVFFIGPAPNCIMDAAGNYLSGTAENNFDNPNLPAIGSFVTTLETSDCANVYCEDVPPHTCKCTHFSPPPPPYTTPPPSAPGSAPNSNGGGLEGQTVSSSSSAAIAAIFAILLLPLLLYLWRLCQRRRAKAHKQALEGRLEQLMALVATFEGNPESHDPAENDEVLWKLNQVMLSSWKSVKDLQDAASELIDNGARAEGHLSADPLQEVLRVGNDLACRIFGRASASDRETLELIHVVLHSASSVALSKSGGGVRLQPPRLVGPDEPRPLPKLRTMVVDALPPNLNAALAAFGGNDEQEQINMLRDRLEELSILPPALTAALAVEHARRHSQGSSGTEHELVELLRMMLRRPSQEAEVANNSGAVRLPPPQLLPFDPRQDGENLTPWELNELLRVSLESKLKSFRDDDGGGGIKLRPPMLRPPRREERRRPLDVPNEEDGPLAVLASGCNGGGGVKVHPPKLLNALHSNDAAAVDDEDRLGIQMSVPPSYAANPTMTDEDLAAMQLQCLIAPLDPQLYGGGGARVPPPKLRPPAQLRVEQAQIEWEEAQQGASSFDEVLADVSGMLRAYKSSQMEVTREVLLSQLEDTVVQDEISLTQLNHLDESPLSVEDGGGVRLRPPKLLANGGHSAIAQVEEICFLQSVGADAEAIAEVLRMNHDPDFSSARPPRPIEEAALGVSADVTAGGGVKVRPPVLLPVGLLSMAVKVEEITFLEELGVGNVILVEAVNSSGLVKTDNVRETRVERSYTQVELAVTHDEQLANSFGANATSIDIDTPLHPLLDVDLDAGCGAGGGLRLPPPKLLPVGTQTAYAKMDEIMYLEALGASAADLYAVIGSAQDILGVSGVDGAAGDTDISDMTVDHDSSISVDELCDGIHAGGGVRLRPPKLLPVGVESAVAKADARAFYESMGGEFEAKQMISRHSFIGAQMPHLQAHEREVKAIKLEQSAVQQHTSFETLVVPQLPPRVAPIQLPMAVWTSPKQPPPPPLLQRNSTKELLDTKRVSNCAPRRQGSMNRRSMVLTKQASDGAMTAGKVDNARELSDEDIATLNGRPRAPLAPKVVANREVFEGFDGGGGVRIGPGLLHALAPMRRAPRFIPGAGLASAAPKLERTSTLERNGSSSEHLHRAPILERAPTLKSAPTLSQALASTAVDLVQDNEVESAEMHERRMQMREVFMRDNTLELPPPSLPVSSSLPPSPPSSPPLPLPTASSVSAWSGESTRTTPPLRSHLKRVNTPLRQAPTLPGARNLHKKPTLRRAPTLQKEPINLRSPDVRGAMNFPATSLWTSPHAGADVKPDAMTDEIYRTLCAEAKRAHGSANDSIRYGHELVDAYDRASGDVNLLLSTFGGGGVRPAKTPAEQRVAAAVSVALNQFVADRCLVKRQASRVGSEGLNANLYRRIEELKDEIACIDTDPCPARCICSGRPARPRKRTSKHTTRKASQVAPAAEKLQANEPPLPRKHGSKHATRKASQVAPAAEELQANELP